MIGRVFIVVYMSEMNPNLSAKGEAFFATARKSIDGLQAILDYNHKDGYINSLFVPNPQAYLDTLTVMTQAEALALMQTANWLSDEVF